MRSGKLVLFGIVTVAALAAAVVATRLRAPAELAQKPLLFPDLRAHANDVAGISVHGHDRTITLARDGDRWVVREADGYPALIDRVRETVVSMAELRHVADRTSNAKMFNRLDVEDVDQPGSNSVLLELKDGGGKTLAALIAGRVRPGTTRAEPPALYARRPRAANALLVEGKLNVSTDIGRWINRDLFDVAADRVRSIEIVHGDGDRVSLSRDRKGADLVLAGVPQGKEPQSSVELSRMGTVLETFFLENARASGNITFPADAASMTVRTFDGLVATLISARIDDKPMTRVSFAFEPPPEPAPATVKGDAEPTASETAAPGLPAAETPPGVEPTAPDAKAEAEKFNAAVQGWVFQVPQFKFDLLTRRADNLVRDPLPKGESPIKLPE